MSEYSIRRDRDRHKYFLWFLNQLNLFRKDKKYLNAALDSVLYCSNWDDWAKSWNEDARARLKILDSDLSYLKEEIPYPTPIEREEILFWEYPGLKPIIEEMYQLKEETK